MKLCLLSICLFSLLASLPLTFQAVHILETLPEAAPASLSIRKVDFRNFTYPWPKNLIDLQNPKKTFRLKNGDWPIIRNKNGDIVGGASLGKINYGDVSGDGLEEAIIYISVVSGGSAMPGIIYVYSLENAKPKMLWHFATGDRADEGYKKAYSSNGNLVVELFSPIESRGACCPTKFTRSTYEWQGTRFKQKQKLLLPIQQSN